MGAVKKLIKNHTKEIKKNKEKQKKNKLKEFLRNKNKKYLRKIFIKEYLKHTSSKYSVEDKKVHQMNYDLQELYETLSKQLEKDDHPKMSYDEFLNALESIENDGEFEGYESFDRFEPAGRSFSCIIELVKNEVVIYFDEG